MFAVGALSVQNVNAQNPVRKNQTQKETVKQDTKQETKKASQTINDSNGTTTKKNAMKKETSMKNDTKAQNNNATSEPHVKDKRHLGKKSDQKTPLDPQQDVARPKYKGDAKAEKKTTGTNDR